MNARKLVCWLIASIVWSIAPATSAAEIAPSVAPVRVFDAGELTLGGYTVIKRLWVGSWSSAFWIGTHADASAALTSEAASLGANGVTDLYCVKDVNAWFGSGYLCYGLAIKLR